VKAEKEKIKKEKLDHATGARGNSQAKRRKKDIKLFVEPKCLIHE